MKDPAAEVKIFFFYFFSPSWMRDQIRLFIICCVFSAFFSSLVFPFSSLIKLLFSGQKEKNFTCCWYLNPEMDASICNIEKEGPCPELEALILVTEFNIVDKDVCTQLCLRD